MNLMRPSLLPAITSPITIQAIRAMTNTRAKAGLNGNWSKTPKPRCGGEHQPNVPLGGYTDESDPKVMARKIGVAADNGINAFIFDWYYYDDGPFLQGCLDDGFLKATNVNRITFALMWANHDWFDLHPSKRGTPQKLLYPGKVPPERFDQICDYVIQHYFLHPSYWRIDGKPYF